MNAKTRRAIIAAMLLLGLLAILLFMPLRIPASAAGIAARSSQGSIVSGSLRDVSIGRIRVGDVNARLRLLPILAGRLGFALQRGDAPFAPGVSGTVGRSFGGPFADQISLTLDGGSVLPGLEGSELRLEAVSFAFSGGKCQSASGTVRLRLQESALASVVRGGMIGNAQCSNGDLFLPLISDSTMERAAIRLKSDGRFQSTFLVSAPSAEIALALGSAGFQPVSGGFRLVRSGKLR